MFKQTCLSGTESNEASARNEYPNENFWFNVTEFLQGGEIPAGLSDRAARARTFRYNRWPHAHLSPEEMADAGLFYTGKCSKII